MQVHRLDDATAARLAAADLTYDRSATPLLGAARGVRRFERSARLTRTDLDGTAADLLAWRLQAAAGLRVRASDVPLRVGTVVLLGLGPRWLRIEAPCRVVALVDEPTRRGFVYGTLPGHPECGEESFVVEEDDEGLRVTVAATSRPATLLARLGGPVTHRVQDAMTARYLRVLDGVGGR
ncbi:DUF1990 family protein [uncultured Nocardioides sp.]|uniref:DUF1990 family protein n=1 Tax=uncultured Nocardioides sp. TaxID=198441 RepID=UPI002636BF6D|nr:DUF1990 domain-containing protein [uncultured Nocardioides sp.]